MKPANETTPKVSYSQHDFIKLKELWDAIQHSQKQLDDKKQALQNAVESNESHRDSSSIIQNKQIRLRMYKEQIKQQKLRIHTAQMKLNAAEEAK
uniref:Uncharacterized protein n=1 Tax=Panagrolaimus sp. JU765 TaxID=591449 RepID=A0AC34RCZ9_9BILA